jgi:lambda family phage portal protein
MTGGSPPPPGLSKPRIRVRAGSAPRLDSGAAALIGAPSAAPLTPAHYAARVGRRLSSWRPPSSGPNSIVAASGPELLRRSRDLRRNNPHAARAMSLLTTHIVGMGIKPRSLCKHAGTRDALTELWADWCALADADSSLDFYGLQALAVAELVEAGESFARLRPRRLSDGLPVPLQVQLIPTEQLPLDYTLPNGPTTITQAIERNPIGARIAFWVYPEHPGDRTFAMGSLSGLTPVRISANDICHLFDAGRIGQQRGLPWLSSTMTTLHQLWQYTDAELLRKQLTTAIVGFVRKPVAEDVMPASLEAQFGTVESSEEGKPADVTQEPGTMQYLEAGQEVVFNNPPDVGNNFDAFLAATFRSVAAGAGVLYEDLSGDWRSMNDRTYRAAFNTFKRQVRMWQWNLVCQQFNIPIWNRFIDFAVASGALRQPKSVDDADIRRVEWRPERWDYIQPVQDLEATALAIGLGLTSRSGEISERGDDPEVVDAQIAADREREDALGLEFPAGTAKALAQPPPPAAAAPTATPPEAVAEAESESPGGPSPAQEGAQ